MDCIYHGLTSDSDFLWMFWGHQKLIYNILDDLLFFYFTILQFRPQLRVGYAFLPQQEKLKVCLFSFRHMHSPNPSSCTGASG